MTLARTLRTAILAAIVLVAACCGDDGITVENVTAEGSVGGIIVHGATRMPLADVQVSLIAGGTVFEAVTTAEDGLFAFNGVPAGVVIVMITAPAGYENAWMRGVLPAAAGDYPAGNSTLTLGPIGLIPTDGEFNFRVIDEAGVPVSGYQVGVQTRVQYLDLGTGVPDAQGEVLKSATTDSDGYATLAAMPNYFALGPSVPDGIIVFLPPRDGNADGIFEFGGGDRIFNLRDLDDPTPDVILTAGYSAILAVRASTISALVAAGGAPALIQSNGAIHVTFNLPIQANVDVTVVDEYGNPPASQPSISIRDDNLTISFATAMLDAGAEYNLSIHAVAAVGDRLVEGDFVAPFFTVPGASEVTVAKVARDGATQVVTVTFSEPIGGIDGALSGGNCVIYFQVDIDSAGGIGNAINELGYGACNVQIYTSEPDPAGPVGASGYTTRWAFTAPAMSGGGPIPGNLPVHIVFSGVGTAGRIVERADGSPSNDLMFLMPP